MNVIGSTGRLNIASRLLEVEIGFAAVVTGVVAAEEVLPDVDEDDDVSRSPPKLVDCCALATLPASNKRLEATSRRRHEIIIFPPTISANANAERTRKRSDR